MMERFDHRPMLTATLALATSVLVVVVLTLATLLITGPQAASPPSASGAGNPAAHAQSGGRAGAYFGNDSLREQHVPPVVAAPKEMDAELYGEVYGWDLQPKAAQRGGGKGKSQLFPLPCPGSLLLSPSAHPSARNFFI
jgi:hypothetical protein